MSLDSGPAHAHHAHMTDENEDPLADLKKGIGLLFRAAKSAAHKIPKDKIEDAFKSSVEELQKAVEKLPTAKIEGTVKTSLQEMGRAFVSVATTLEREVAGTKVKSEPPAPPAEAAKSEDQAPEDAHQRFDDAYAPEPEDPTKKK
jgi:hypothetical protein